MPPMRILQPLLQLGHAAASTFDIGIDQSPAVAAMSGEGDGYGEIDHNTVGVKFADSSIN